MVPAVRLLAACACAGLGTSIGADLALDAVDGWTRWNAILVVINVANLTLLRDDA